MSGFRTVDLYDPEDPSADDDLCFELDELSEHEGCELAVQCVSRSASQVNLSVENASTIVANTNQKFSGFTEWTSAVNRKNEDFSDAVQADDEHIKPLFVNKPTVIWKSAKRLLAPALKVFDDVETVNENTVKASLNVSSSDTLTKQASDLEHCQQLPRSQQMLVQCSDSLYAANDQVDSTVSDVLDNINAQRVSPVEDVVTVKDVQPFDRKKEQCSTLQMTPISEPSILLNQASIVSEPVDQTEPDNNDNDDDDDDDDEVMSLSQQSRRIKHIPIEDPSEPEDIMQASDHDSKSEHTECPRIIRLDRDNTKSNSVAHLCDISDPSEPTDTESLGDDETFPREIKLNRVEDARSSIGSFAITPHVSCMLAKTDTSVVNSNSAMHSSESNTVNNFVYSVDTPLSPVESIRSLVDSEHDEMQDSESVSADHSLSDGEIMDEEKEEEFGIFQISASFNRNEKKNNEWHAERCGKKRRYEDSEDDDGLKYDSKSEDAHVLSKRKRCKEVLKDTCTSDSSTSSLFNEWSDELTRLPVHHENYEKSKATSKLPSTKELKDKEVKIERVLSKRSRSTSSEKLLVGYGRARKRTVVFNSNSGDESQKAKCSEHFHSSVRVTCKSPPRYDRSPLCKKSLNSNLLKPPKKKQYVSKRHHKHHTRRNGGHASKHRRKHKKHRKRKHQRNDEDSVNFERSRNRSRVRSYDNIVEMIHFEEQQSPRARRLQSVVVHKNACIGAQQHSSSSFSSHDSNNSVDDFALSDVFHGLDNRSENISSGHLHLSRLVYAGGLEQNGQTTLLGECIKSKYGQDYDVSCISRNLANLCYTTDDADVEILGISYPGRIQSDNSSVQIADVRNELRDGSSDCEVAEEVTDSLVHQQPDIVPMDTALAETGEHPVTVGSSHKTDADDIGSKKVTVLSEGVQTQIPLFAETSNCTTESSKFPDSSQSMPCSHHGIAGKEIQVTSDDNEEEFAASPNSAVLSCCNTVMSEVVSDIKSPEKHTEEGSHVPRPVLLESLDAPKLTSDSPQQDFSDLYVTVPNFSRSKLPVGKAMALQQVEKSAQDSLLESTVTDFITPEKEEHLSLGKFASGQTEVGSIDVPNGNPGLTSCNAVNAEKLLSIDSSGNHYVPSNSQWSKHGTSSAFHHLPPTVHKPDKYQRVVPLHVANLPDMERQTATVNGRRSTVLPDSSAVQRLQSEPVLDVSHRVQPQSTDSWGAILNRVLPAVPSKMHQDDQNRSNSSNLLESLSFFTLKSGCIPGICEDVEPAANHYETTNDTSFSSCLTGIYSDGFMQTSQSLNGVSVAVTTATASLSNTRYVPRSSVVTSSLITSSHVTSDMLSSSLAGTVSARCSTIQSPVIAAVKPISANAVTKQPVSSTLLGTIASCLFRMPFQQQHTQTVSSASCTSVAHVTVDSDVSDVSSSCSVLTGTALRNATTTVTSTAATSAWITSLPQSTIVDKPQPSNQLLRKPVQELDFDVDAVVSPRSDEILSFSPPSSEQMMAIVKMKRSCGSKRKSKKDAADGVEKSEKRSMTVGCKILIDIRIFLLLLHVFSMCIW